MEVKKALRNIVFSCSCLFLATGVKADLINIDLKGDVYNTYILNDNGGFEAGGSRWSLKDLFNVESELNFNFSYDTSYPGLGGEEEDGKSVGWYKGQAINISSSLFEAKTSDSSDVGITVVNELFLGWDSLYVGFSDKGIKFDHNGDTYALIAGNLSVDDESGLSLDDSSLPQSQSTLDAFWLNKPIDASYDHVANLSLQFKKLSSLDSIDYVGNETFYVIGHFDAAKLSKVPEPAGLGLALMGLICLFTRRFNRD